MWAAILVAGWLAVSAWLALPHFGLARGITEANFRRLSPGMTQAEVEAILGAPNPLPELARKGEAFWDANAMLGFRYVGIHVYYDSEGRVARKKVRGFWNSRPPRGDADGLVFSIAFLVVDSLVVGGVVWLVIVLLRRNRHMSVPRNSNNSEVQ